MPTPISPTSSASHSTASHSTSSHSTASITSPNSSRISSRSATPISQLSTATAEEESASFYPASYFFSDDHAIHSGNVTPNDYAAEVVSNAYDDPPSDSQLETSSNSSSEALSNAQSTSSVVIRDELPSVSSFTFFNTSASIFRTSRYPDHINVVNIDGYKTSVIHCDDDAVLDMLCTFIPRADGQTMNMLACIQALRLEVLHAELGTLESEYRRLEAELTAVQQEINERIDMRLEKEHMQAVDIVLESEVSEHDFCNQGEFNDYLDEDQTGYDDPSSCRL